MFVYEMTLKSLNLPFTFFWREILNEFKNLNLHFFDSEKIMSKLIGFSKTSKLKTSDLEVLELFLNLQDFKILSA